MRNVTKVGRAANFLKLYNASWRYFESVSSRQISRLSNSDEKFSKVSHWLLLVSSVEETLVDLADPVEEYGYEK